MLENIKHVRDKMGLTNIEVMIPFVRTLKEAKGVIDVLASHGLKRGENGLKIISLTIGCDYNYFKCIV